MRLRLFLLPLLLAVCAAAPARAQAGAAPYDKDLLRLSEILGGLHYLRAICGSKEGQAWRNEMQALLDAEAPSGERRNRMTASFNRGYRGFQQTYRSCTPAANLAIRRYLEEGSRIVKDVTARYGT
ncbi:MAG: TIGR02301 family protein [Variibacter sp.]|nr:TIGR02301 family protein [Variibacter sp.]